MLITKEWSDPKKLTYGQNITLQYSKPGFDVRIFNANGVVLEKQVMDGKQVEIRAAKISAISHPMISLKAMADTEIHVHIETPLY